MPAGAQIIDTIAGNSGAGNSSSSDSRDPRQIPLVISRAVAVDPSGAYLYIGDDGTRTVRRIDLSSGVASIVAGGGTGVDDSTGLPGRAVSLISPVALAVDGGGNVLIVDDTNNRVRRLTPDGRVTTIVGNGVPGFAGDGGPATRARLNLPGGIALDRVGNIYIADRENFCIRKVDRFTNIITTIVGADPDEESLGLEEFPADQAWLLNPTAVASDSDGNLVFADADAHVVYRYDARTRRVRRLTGMNGVGVNYGDGGPAADAFVSAPQGVTIARNGDIYIGALGAVRKITAATGIISTLVGNGSFTLADGRDARSVFLSSGNSHLALTPNEDRLFFATGGDHVIAEVNLHSNTFRIVAGNPAAVGDGSPALTSTLAQPDKIALDAVGNLYVADTFHHRIRKIAPGATGPGTGAISTVAGTGNNLSVQAAGPALTTPIAFPRGITTAPNGDVFFTEGDRFIRRLDANSILTIVAGVSARGYAGDGGPATSARFNGLSAVVADNSGNLYVADADNHRVRRISASGIVTTVAGTGEDGYTADEGMVATATKLSRPTDLAISPNGKLLFISDYGNRRVLVLFTETGEFFTVVRLRTELGGLALTSDSLFIGARNRILRLDFETFDLDTIAGDGKAGFSGDGGLATLARMSFISGMVVDREGNLLLSDSVSNRVRRVLSTRVLPVLSVAPRSLTFSTSQGGPAPAPQNLPIGSGNLVGTAWSAAVQMLDGAGWLALDQRSGATPALPAVSVDASRLTPGTYAGRIVVSAPSAINSPTEVSVSLVVSPALAPKLDIGPQQVSFRATQGSSQSLSQTVLVNNSGGGTLNYAATVAAGNWISVTPVTGAGPATVTVSASPAGLAPGTYQGEVRFANRSANLATPNVESVFVTLVVEAARPVLQVSHTSFVFTASEAGSFVPAQALSVINNGTGTANWSATATPLSGGEWLSLSSRVGGARAGAASRMDLSASPVVAGRPLAPGVYDTLVTLTAPGAANSPQIVLARLRVEGLAGAPLPSIAPGGQVIAVQAGETRTFLRTFTLASSGGASLSYNASVRTDDGGGWLRLENAAGSIISSADAVAFPVNVVPAGLPVGTYRGHIAFSFSQPGTISSGSGAGNAAASTAEATITLVIAPAASAIRSGAEPALRASAADGPSSGDLTLPRSAACNSETLIPQITSITNGLQLPVGWPAGIRAVVVDNCGFAVPRASVIATIVPPGAPQSAPPGASSSAAADPEYVTLTPLGEGQYSANYSLTRAGSYPMFVTAASPGLLTGRSDTVVASSAAGGAGGNLQTPAVTRDGVVSGASFRSFANLAPGQIVSVFGNNLGSLPSNALSTPLPTELAGVAILLGGQRMPLYFSGASQLNAQVPFELPTGSALPLVVVQGGKASPPEQVSLARSSPGLFTANQSGQGLGIITNAAGEPITATNPARRGEVIIAYGTGLGATTPAVPSGTVSPASPAAQTVLPVRASFNSSGGTLNAPVEFAGLTPGYVGLYQVNIRVPADAPAGAAVELTIEQDGITSTPVTLPVQ